MNQIYRILVKSFNGAFDRIETEFQIFGFTNAIERGKRFGDCDNVLSVEVVNIFTGEIILSVLEGQITWLVEEE